MRLHYRGPPFPRQHAANDSLPVPEAKRRDGTWREEGVTNRTTDDQNARYQVNIAPRLT